MINFLLNFYSKVHKPAVTPLATGQNLLKTNAGDVKPSPRGPSASVGQPAASSVPRAESTGGNAKVTLILASILKSNWFHSLPFRSC